MSVNQKMNKQNWLGLLFFSNNPCDLKYELYYLEFIYFLKVGYVEFNFQIIKIGNCGEMTQLILISEGFTVSLSCKHYSISRFMQNT